jgi:hypothetical protein
MKISAEQLSHEIAAREGGEDRGEMEGTKYTHILQR